MNKTATQKLSKPIKQDGAFTLGATTEKLTGIRSSSGDERGPTSQRVSPFNANEDERVDTHTAAIG